MGFIIYMIAAYWAAGVIMYEGKVVVYSHELDLVIKKITVGFIFGIALIPMAIIKRIMKGRP